MLLGAEGGSRSDTPPSGDTPPSDDAPSPRVRWSTYRTTPLQISSRPPGVANIIVNEAAERFSYYGMRSILVVFMTQHLRDGSGTLAVLSESEARECYHAFSTAVYFTPIIGALIAASFLGTYRTIIGFSLVYCAGHAALAINETLIGMVFGLSLISLGSGGIKPCVSACLGDQFCTMNAHLISSTFGYFYLAINLGAFTSTLLTPWLLHSVGSHLAFGVPGLMMALATVVFWCGRGSYCHVPPYGLRFWREAFGPEGRRALGKLAVIYLFVAVYYSLYDQTGSAWVLQATHMNRHFLGHEWLPSQIGAINALLILLLVPLFNGIELRLPLHRLCARASPAGPPVLRVTGLYALAGRHVRVTPLRKMSLGFFLLALSFGVTLLIETWIEAGQTPNIGWQLLAYVVLTVAEVHVSVTGLEFSYTQAPPCMKSVVMACYLMSSAVGNLLTVLVNHLIREKDGTSKWTNVTYYRFFTLLMLASAILFVPYAACYQERSYVRGGGASTQDAGSESGGAEGGEPPPEERSQLQCGDLRHAHLHVSSCGLRTTSETSGLK